MKRIICAVAALALFSAGLCAGEIWQTDFKKASEEAKAAKKFMVLDFSGSDWCGWCKKLDAEVFSTKEFKEYAEKNLVCVLLDFPRSKEQSDELKKQNKELAGKYKIRGYPTVLVLSPDGELVETTGYQDGGGAKYVEYLKGVIEKFQKKAGEAESKGK